MSHTLHRTLVIATGVTAMVAFAGCSNYVKKNDFNAKIAQLQQKMQSNHQDLQQQINSLAQTMKQHFAKYDAEITAMKGRIRIDTVSHFATNKTNLDQQDKALLSDFAKVMRTHHSDALVTVEGFADPSGSTAYNKKLGEERAEVVRNYLVNQGGMAASQVRTVSYGESKDRQVKKGATGPAGRVNRRVSLVIDFAGDMQHNGMGMGNGMGNSNS